MNYGKNCEMPLWSVQRHRHERADYGQRLPLPRLPTTIRRALGQQRLWQQRLSLTVVTLLWGFAVYGLYDVLQTGIVVLRMGNWLPPYGIILVADALSMTMVALTMTIALAVTLFSLPTVDTSRQDYFYYPLFFILLMGVNGGHDLLWYKYTGNGESDVSGRLGWAPRSGNRIGINW